MAKKTSRQKALEKEKMQAAENINATASKENSTVASEPVKAEPVPKKETKAPKQAVVFRDQYKEHKELAATIYMLAIFIVYVLFCPHGYVNYDGDKIVIYSIISAIFLAGSAILFIQTACERDGMKYIKSQLTAIDYCVFALIVIWIISFIGCRSDLKHQAMFGDTYRNMGLTFNLMYLLGFFVIAHWGNWTKIINTAFLIMCGCEWFSQIIMYVGIDPLDWQFSHEYSYLIGTLGAVDQNGYFDGIVMIVILCLFVFATTRKDQIIYGVFLFVGFIASITANSDSFEAALGLGIIVLFGYFLYKKEYMLELTKGIAIMYLGAWGFRGIYAVNTFEGTYLKHGVGAIEKMLLNNKLMILALVLIAVMAGVSILIRKTSDKVGKVMSIGFFSLCALAIIAVVGIIIYATADPESCWGTWKAPFVMNKDFGTGRGYVWGMVVNMFNQRPMFGKLFGGSFSTMSEELYVYNEVYNELGEVWADAHNTFIDMLASSGIIGMIAYIVMLIMMAVRFVKGLAGNDKVVIPLAVLAGYVGASLINSNLITVTAVVFVLLGIGCRMTGNREK